MANHSQFLSTLENRSNPVITLKELIEELFLYTNKTPAYIADKLENLIFGFRKGGSHNQYDNAFVYCTVFEFKPKGEKHSYEPMSNHFKDTFDHIKGYLNDVIANNEFNNLELTRFAVRGSEIAKLIKEKVPELLDKSPPTSTETISQLQGDYISLYEFIEWASKHYSNLSETANDLSRLLKNKNIQLYRQYGGISPSIDKDNTNLKQALDFVVSNNGYEKQPDDFDFDIPF